MESPRPPPSQRLFWDPVWRPFLSSSFASHFHFILFSFSPPLSFARALVCSCRKQAPPRARQSPLRMVVTIFLNGTLHSSLLCTHCSSQLRRPSRPTRAAEGRVRAAEEGLGQPRRPDQAQGPRREDEGIRARCSSPSPPSLTPHQHKHELTQAKANIANLQDALRLGSGEAVRHLPFFSLLFNSYAPRRSN